MTKIVMEPIGFVRTQGVKGEGDLSLIVLRKDLTTALDGIQDFSHIWVLLDAQDLEGHQ